jgi:hypothetical protein
VGTDGSSKHSKWPHLASAGSAAYQVDNKGNRRAMRWTLPKGFPQTPAASEKYAFDMVVRSVRPGCTVEVLVDCEAVQKCWRSLSWASRAQAKYAGIWKNPIISSTVTMVHTIKSHMSKDQATARGVSLERFYLNQEVDIQAGMTLREYTKADEKWVADVVGRIKQGIMVAKALDSLGIVGWTAVVRQSKKGKRAKLARPRRDQHDMAWLASQKRALAVHRMRHSHGKTPVLGGALQEVFLACWRGIQG